MSSRSPGQGPGDKARNDSVFRIACVGQAKAGTTSLIKRYLHDYLAPSILPAYAGGNEFFIKSYPNMHGKNSVHLHVWDLSSGLLYNSCFNSARFHGFVVVLDAHQPNLFEQALELQARLQQLHAATASENPPTPVSPRQKIAIGGSRSPASPPPSPLSALSRTRKSPPPSPSHLQPSSSASSSSSSSDTPSNEPLPPTVIVFNKLDGDSPPVLPAASVIDSFCSQHNFVDWVGTSCYSGSNVAQPFMRLVRRFLTLRSLSNSSLPPPADSSAAATTIVTDTGLYPVARSLHLRDAGARLFPAWLLRSRCLSLRLLDLSYCGIAAVPAQLEQLRCLESLNLEGNQLHVLPDTLHRLTNLSALNLSHNCLQLLPSRLAGFVLQKLVRLDYGGNPWQLSSHSTDTREFLTSFVDIRTLRTMWEPHCARLVDLLKRERMPPDQEQLVRILCQSNSSMALSFWNFHLIVGCQQSVDMTLIWTLFNIMAQHNLSHTALGKHISAMWESPQGIVAGFDCPPPLPQPSSSSFTGFDSLRSSLVWLDLSSAELRQLPDCIFDISPLQHLYIAYNDLTVIPDAVQQLTALVGLYCEYNRLTAVPAAVAQLHSLQCLTLHHNPIDDVPADLLDGSDPRPLQAYLTERELQARPTRYATLCFVGEPASGKSTLVKSLKTAAPPPENRSFYSMFSKLKSVGARKLSQLGLSGAPAPTHGVCTEEWLCRPSGSPASATYEQSFFCLVHDFGSSQSGQFFSQPFLSPNALFVLSFSLLNAGKAVAQLRDWLAYLHWCANDPPVLLVGTHLDLFGGKLGAVEDDIKKAFPPDRHPNILDVVFTSNSTGDGIDLLKDKILKVLQQRAHLQSLHPLFGLFADEIVQIRKQNLSVFGLSILADMAARFGIDSERPKSSKSARTDIQDFPYYGAILKRPAATTNNQPHNVPASQPSSPTLTPRGRAALSASSPGVIFNTAVQTRHSGELPPGIFSSLHVLSSLGVLTHVPAAKAGLDRLVFNPLWMSNTLNQLAAAGHLLDGGVLLAEYLPAIFSLEPKLTMAKRVRLLDLLERLDIAFVTPRLPPAASSLVSSPSSALSSLASSGVASPPTAAAPASAQSSAFWSAISEPAWLATAPDAPTQDYLSRYGLEHRPWIVPCFLPAEAPSTRDAWFRREGRFAERLYVFPWLHSSLMPRIVLRMLNAGFTPVELWRNGVSIEMMRQRLRLSVTSPSTVSLLYEGPDAVEHNLYVMERGEWLCDSLKNSLLAAVVDTLECLLEECGGDYGATYRRKAACPHCLALTQFRDAPDAFDVDSCLEAVSEDRAFLFCRRNNQRPVHVYSLLPELYHALRKPYASSDVALRLRLGKHRGNVEAPPPLDVDMLNPALPSILLLSTPEDEPSPGRLRDNLGDGDGAAPPGAQQFYRFAVAVGDELLDQRSQAVAESIVRSFRHLQHPNVHFPCRVAVDPVDDVPVVLTELLPAYPRTLTELVRDHNTLLDPAHKDSLLVRIALDVACALDFLHQTVPPITHGHLTSSMVLLRAEVMQPGRLPPICPLAKLIGFGSLTGRTTLQDIQQYGELLVILSSISASHRQHFEAIAAICLASEKRSRPSLRAVVSNLLEVDFQIGCVSRTDRQLSIQSDADSAGPSAAPSPFESSPAWPLRPRPSAQRQTPTTPPPALTTMAGAASSADTDDSPSMLGFELMEPSVLSLPWQESTGRRAGRSPQRAPVQAAEFDAQYEPQDDAIYSSFGRLLPLEESPGFRPQLRGLEYTCVAQVVNEDRWMWLGTETGVVVVRACDNGRYLNSFAALCRTRVARIAQASRGEVWVASSSGDIAVWPTSCSTGPMPGPLRVFRAHSGTVSGLVPYPHDNPLVMWTLGRADGLLIRWSVTTCQAISFHETLCNAKVVALCGSMLWVGCARGLVAAVDANSGKPLRTWRAHTATITTILPLASGRHVVTASADGFARVWCAATGEFRWSLSHASPRLFSSGTASPTHDRFWLCSFVRGVETQLVNSFSLEVDEAPPACLQTIVIEASECSKALFHVSNAMIWTLGSNIHVLKPRSSLSLSVWPDHYTSSIGDLVLDPKHSNLPNVPLAPLAGSGEPGVDIVGLADDTTQYQDVMYGRLASSYPLYPDGNRQGDPICDYYRVHYHPLRTVLAVADGCNWGPRPRDAAHRAANSFIEYLAAMHRKANSLRELGFLLMRGFSVAHSAIISQEDSAQVTPGTTTLLGGVIAKLTAPVDPQQPACDWIFVYASVGDCRAFRWNCASKEITALGSHHQRQSVTDAKDPGGRLGPHHGQFPDTRNFDICAVPVQKGDLLWIVSDGVTDNLDPQNLGLTPHDIKPDRYAADVAWSAMPVPEAQALIDGHICAMTKQVIGPASDSASLSPALVVSNLVEHALKITEPSRDFMLSKPHAPLPKDYRAFPGKMDHTTAVALRV